MAQNILIAVCLLLLTACAPSNKDTSGNRPENNAITVSAAVSLRDAFNEIGEVFKQRKGVSVSFNFGSSGALQKQIETGAPVDVFASAGEKQMDDLASKGLINAESRSDFATNTLVLIVPADSGLSIAAFADLANPQIKKIAVGNSKTVPAGQYTEQVFTKLNLGGVVSSRMIYAEDVRQVLDYVVRGEVDAGLVYATDAKSAGAKVRVAATAPEETHDAILYPIASIEDSKDKSPAQDFIALVLSPDGQAILKKYGFGPMKTK